MKKMKKLTCLALLAAPLSVFYAQISHTVKQGETLYSLSKKYNVEISKIYASNPELKEGTLNIGQIIQIPGKSGRTAVKNQPEQLARIVLEPKDTLYSLAKKYHLTVAEIQKLNPDLKMQIGEVILIPLKNFSKYADRPQAKDQPAETSKTTDSNAEYTLYEVQNGDTVFGIINKFNIELSDLLAMNPDVENGLKAGSMIKVKKISGAFAKKASNAVEVNLLLPFGFNGNTSKYRSIAIEFLKGAKLAAERSVAYGTPVHLRVIDAGDETAFKNSLSQINKNNTDLIIGPFFKSNLLEVMEYVKDTKIPVVAPFANTPDLYGFDNLIIVESSPEIYTNAITEEITKAYKGQKIWILSGKDQKSASANMAVNLRKSLGRNTVIQDVTTAREIKNEKNMMTGAFTPSIIVNISGDEQTISDFASQVISLSEENEEIKAFSAGYAPIFDKESAALSKASLVYIMDRKINTDGDFENRILKDYYAKYCETPSKYSVIGFDVMNDMLFRMGKNKDLFRNLKKEQTQLATKFQYEKVQDSKAYINTGYRIVRLIP